MAVFNEILAGRFNKGLNKLFSMKGPAPSPQLASEIAPVLPLFYGNECRYLEGWQRYGATLRIAASAGNLNQWRFRMPAGFPGAVAIIEQISIGFVQADEFRFRIDLVNSSDLTTLFTTTNSLDNRGQVQPSAHLSFTNPAASGVANYEDVFGALNSTVQIIAHQDDELTILPDMQLTVNNLTVNVITAASIRWRERVLEESEALSKSGG